MVTKILIIGGGNCGLSLAHGLKKAKIEHCIFERDSEDDFYNRPRDWGMLLHWAEEYMKKLLPPDLQVRMREIRCDPNLDPSEPLAPVPFVNVVTGELIVSFPMESTSRISRMKLRRLLTEGQDVNIKFGKILDSVAIDGDQVTATFRDGTIASGDVLIGCDGAKSKVREFLVGPAAAKPQTVGLTMMNFPQSGYTADEARLLQSLHPMYKIGIHPTRPGNVVLAALDVANRDDPTTWRFQNYIGWWGPPYAEDLKDPESRLEFYRSLVSTFCEPFRTAGMKCDDGNSLPIYKSEQWAPRMEWNNHGGKVTLAGDAAHSMLPQRGQGLNNAIKDASSIVDAIEAATSGRATLTETITAYESEMRPRGIKEVDLSLEQAMKLKDQHTLLESPLFKHGWNKGRAGYVVEVPKQSKRRA